MEMEIMEIEMESLEIEIKIQMEMEKIAVEMDRTVVATRENRLCKHVNTFLKLNLIKIFFNK